VAALWEHGTSGIHVQPGAPGKLVLVAYFSERDALVDELSDALSLHGAAIEPAAIPDVDWVARFRESFRPFRAGGFQIVPDWDPPPPDAAPERILRIHPARAFGTGTHESTRFCLAALESLSARGPLGRVVDVGTGTGILAVAAARLGARAVTAVDIDPEAVDSARLHAGLNGVEVRLVRGDGGGPLAAGRFDLVLANLSAPLLRDKRDELMRLRAPGGFAVLAGFLREDAAEIAVAYGGLGRAETLFDGDWAALVIQAGP
jgi:ribosomal protein L11 methyltransferase